jgi:prevent-host-death family protein
MMYISMYMKARRYSIARTRAELPSVVRAVERGAEVEISRRGVPVAVILSVAERERLSSGRKSFGEAFDAFLSGTQTLEPVERGYFERLRDRSKGRKVRL